MDKMIEMQIFLETVTFGTPEESEAALRARAEIDQAEIQAFQAGY